MLSPTCTRLTDTDRNLLKWGITSNLDRRYTLGYLLDKKLTPVASGTRADMLDLERFIVERYNGPLNFESWAGTAR